MSSSAVNVVNTLNAILQVTDNSDQSQILDRNIVLSLPSSVAQGLIALSLASGANAIPLPQTTCYQLYVRNKDQSKYIIVTVTSPENPGTPVEAVVLYPGDVYISWQTPSPKNVLAGFTALSLFAQDPNTLCEYFIGG